ncbi:uroporphyrinogen-III C-methyltransferase [Methylobacillus gramineus]|uniref:uroporphyrinogen-III C-methyltransferase n=1 Tax=Methylobacillus gramineus TaxID=755169 RepID=UPI001CFF5B63|nr:uroporphyrinogen-III C-methyltransferase [Methylobacillus gramineus]MCB5185680.1 uroporphyrinogen-III C-methyltransferase [Methylobacillus gramineus]
MTEQNTPESNTASSPAAATPLVTVTRKPSFFAVIAFILVLLALGILAWQWLNTRHRFIELEQSLTQRLEQFNNNNQQSLALAKNADERSTESNVRIIKLEQQLAESRDQQESLQTLYLELVNNHDERVIAEVEQLLAIANQQLQLAANIKPALLALQTADSRLQHMDSPLAIQLRKAIAKDIQRLQELPLIDVIGMSLKLENLTESIDKLPLVSDRHPKPMLPEALLDDENQLRKLAREVWEDLKQMIRLERVDRAEPPLLAPDQTFFLRENIKLHLLTARIALLQHDENTYRADLDATDQWIKGHFDLRENATKTALTTLKQLSASNIVIQVPDISETLGLVSKYKLTLERSNNSERTSDRINAERGQ